MLPKRRFGSVKVGTKDVMRMFEAIYAPKRRFGRVTIVKDVSTQFGKRTFEKSVENPHYILCSPLSNLRLGGVKLSIFLDNKTLNSASKTHPETLVLPAKSSFGEG